MRGIALPHTPLEMSYALQQFFHLGTSESPSVHTGNHLCFIYYQGQLIQQQEQDVYYHIYISSKNDLHDIEY